MARDLVFVDSIPETRGRKKVYEPLFRQLAERPGEWAIVGTYKNNESARTCRYLLKKRAAAMSVELEARSDKLYGRYVG